MPEGRPSCSWPGPRSQVRSLPALLPDPEARCATAGAAAGSRSQVRRRRCRRVSHVTSNTSSTLASPAEKDDGNYGLHGRSGTSWLPKCSAEAGSSALIGCGRPGDGTSGPDGADETAGNATTGAASLRKAVGAQRLVTPGRQADDHRNDVPDDNPARESGTPDAPSANWHQGERCRCVGTRNTGSVHEGFGHLRQCSRHALSTLATGGPGGSSPRASQSGKPR